MNTSRKMKSQGVVFSIIFYSKSVLDTQRMTQVGFEQTSLFCVITVLKKIGDFRHF